MEEKEIITEEPINIEIIGDETNEDVVSIVDALDAFLDEHDFESDTVVIDAEGDEIEVHFESDEDAEAFEEWVSENDDDVDEDEINVTSSSE